MKLLFDQNLSYKLIKLLEKYFPESTHVSNLKMSFSNDEVIWNYARINNFTIVTQDVDFFELSILKGTPPKIIWLRQGNTSTSAIFETFILNYEKISFFLNDNNTTCLQLF